MKKIIVRPKDGKPAFYFSPLHRGRKSETVLTTECFRCFGGMLLMKKKEGAKEDYPEAGVYVWHILPGCKNYVASIAKYLFQQISFMAQSYEFETLFRCGGLVDTPQNEYRYRHMHKKIEAQFSHRFPHVPIQGEEPSRETLCMTLSLKKISFSSLTKNETPNEYIGSFFKW